FTLCRTVSARNPARLLRSLPAHRLTMIESLTMAAGRNSMARPHHMRSQSANLISASRFILAGLWVAVFFGERSHPGILRAIALGGAASDFPDGRIARWTHSAGGFGRWLDNVADIVFVLTVLACETRVRAIPLYLPALAAASFAQYVADSIWIRGSAVPIK